MHSQEWNDTAQQTREKGEKGPIEIDIDWTPILEQFAEFPEIDLNWETMAKAVQKSMDERSDDESGPARSLIYDLTYRSLSTIGAHANYWVLNSYIDAPGQFWRVSPKSNVGSPMLDGITHVAILFTAALAARLFETLQCEIRLFDEIVTQYAEAATREDSDVALFLGPTR